MKPKKKKELNRFIKFIKDLDIIYIETKRDEPETIYINEVPIKTEQSPFVYISIIGKIKS